MFNRTDGMQHDTRQRIADGSAQANGTQTAPRFEGRATPTASKAEEMIAFLIRRNEARG